MSLPLLLPAPLPNDDERRRANAEHSQANAEDTRANAENTRANAENTRADAEHSQTDARAQQSQGPRRHVFSEEECLAALSSIPGLVVIGILTPAKANTIRGACAAMLQHYQKKQSPADRGGVAEDDLVDMLTRHPEYANMLEPLLAAEQIAAIFARAREDSHGTA